MKSFLIDNLKATDDELIYLEEITRLRSKRRDPLPIGNSGYSSPSIIIDGFLYHGDLVHASNVKLLNSLGIKNIVNVCDCALDQTIINNFNVLWLNIYDELKEDIRRFIDPVNAFLTDCKQKQEKVLVHCQMGISRSSAMILAYLMKFVLIDIMMKNKHFFVFLVNLDRIICHFSKLTIIFMNVVEWQHRICRFFFN